MNRSYTFTTAENEDLPRILEIFAASIRTEYDVGEAVFQRCLDDLSDSFVNRQHDFSFWVAKDSVSGKVIGWISYLPIFQSALKKDTALEASIYFDSAHQKNGFAFDLFQFTLLEIRERDFCFVYASINSHNHSAIRLFTKLGFAVVGTIPASPSVFPYLTDKTLYTYKLR